MKQKKILMLGGLRYLIPVIKAAHELECYVITCDNVPDNIAHKYSDEYHNVSIIDKEAILNLAKELNIDAIMSFAVDPGVVTAAYVSTELGLPGNPYKSVEILQNKALFRKFLSDNNFNVPKSGGYKNEGDALKDIETFCWPVIVKPVDAAGSKGVTRVNSIDEFSSAVSNALRYSISKEFIVEEFIEKKGFSSDSDAFSVNGKLTFMSYSDQRFDEKVPNPYTPSAYTWPSTMNLSHQIELTNEIQRLLNLLDMQTSIYNIEARVGCSNNKAYIMEVSPRGGGNRLSEMLHFATGVELIKDAVRAAVGEDILDINSFEYNGYWAEMILHSNTDGVFKQIKLDDQIKQYVQELDLWVVKGDKVKAFNAANDAIGTLVLRFDTEEQMIEVMHASEKWLNVVVV